MKKKIVLMMISIFLLTGCTATYELDIKEDKLTEHISINNTELTREDKEIYTTNAMPVDYRETCYLDYDRLVLPNEIKKTKNGNYYDITSTEDGLEARSKIKLSDYEYSRALNLGFTSMHVNTYDDYISIYGYDGPAIFNSYTMLDSFDVVITTDKYVSDHDADFVDGNTYTWNFTKEDEDKTLYIEMDSTKVTEKKEEKQKESQLNMTAFIIFGTIFIIAILFIVYVGIRRKQVNKI